MATRKLHIVKQDIKLKTQLISNGGILQICVQYPKMVWGAYAIKAGYGYVQ